MSAVGAIVSEQHRVGVWGPVVALAVLKGAALAGLARIDLVPTRIIAGALEYVPSAERLLHYPAMLIRLPRVAEMLDLALFVTVGALVQGAVIRTLARAWGTALPRRGFWRGVAQSLSLVLLAGLLMAAPFVASRGAAIVAGPDWSFRVGLGAGAVVSICLFVAPAFVVLHGMSLGRSIAASIRIVGRLPLAIPTAVLLVGILHVPGLVLRAPAIRAGVANDPDWILYALLGQLPAEVFGAILAAGLAGYYALRTGVRQPIGWRPAASVTVVLCCLVLASGCDLRHARDLQLRYESERSIARARLRAHELQDRLAPADSTAWLEVVALYDRSLARLGTEWLWTRPADPLETDLERLVCRALLERGQARSRAGRAAQARGDFRLLLDSPIPFRGVRGDAALALADCEDRDGRWNAAYGAYTSWVHGVLDGHWPLHDDGVPVPSYVAGRLRARGQLEHRKAWVDVASAALEAAAQRGEQASDARTARFTLLLGAERWNEAYAALRMLRREHGAADRTGALLVAEASLLAGGLGREKEALGILGGLEAETSPFDAEHRVAGWLLLGEIRFRSGEWREAFRAYQRAGREARSESGRSEAMLGQARVSARLGEIEAARRLYAQLRELYRSTPAGLVAPLEEFRMLRDNGREADARATLPAAIQTYRTVLDRYGTEVPALVAAQYMSECMGLAGNWPRGVAFLDSIVDTFGSDPRAGSLLVRAARLAAEQLDDRGRAGTLLTELYQRYPNSDVAVFAQTLEDSLGLRLRVP